MLRSRSHCRESEILERPKSSRESELEILEVRVGSWKIWKGQIRVAVRYFIANSTTLLRLLGSFFMLQNPVVVHTFSSIENKRQGSRKAISHGATTQPIFSSVQLIWKERIIFYSLVVWSKSRCGMGLPLFITSSFCWKFSFENCFSLPKQSSIFAVGENETIRYCIAYISSLQLVCTVHP